MIDRIFCAVYSSNPYAGSGVSYSCQRVALGLADHGVETEVFVPSIKSAVVAPRYHSGLPYIFDRWRFRPLAVKLQEQKLLKALRRAKGPRVAYLWPDASLDLIRTLKAEGVFLIREMINCHVATAKAILDEAAGRRGSPPSRISAEHLEYEAEVLRLVDRVFAPSPSVVKSLVGNGVSSAKIMATSYGWDPERITPRDEVPPSDGRLTVLFVGRGSLRKGTDTLIEGWLASQVEGRLILVGNMDEDVKRIVAAAPADRVVHVPFTRDVGSFYARSDVFALPSLEEGSPLVTYEAAGAGLPIIATPMGAGNMGRDGVNGFTVAAESAADIADSLRQLARSPELWSQYSEASRRIATEFTWDAVGARRAKLIAGALAGGAAEPQAGSAWAP